MLRFAYPFALAVVYLVVGLAYGCSGQLVGHRGVVVLPANYTYRDLYTVAASKSAGRFAKHRQPIVEHEVERNKVIAQQQELQYPSENLAYLTKNLGDGKSGVELNDYEIFGFLDSRLLRPLSETRFNKPLPEIETERAYAAVAAPLGGVVVGAPSATRPPPAAGPPPPPQRWGQEGDFLCKR